MKRPSLGMAPIKTEVSVEAYAEIMRLEKTIERLRKENQELKLQYLSDQGQWIEETGRLREALRKIAKSQLSDSEQAYLFKMLARAALGEEE